VMRMRCMRCTSSSALAAGALYGAAAAADIVLYKNLRHETKTQHMQRQYRAIARSHASRNVADAAASRSPLPRALGLSRAHHAIALDVVASRPRDRERINARERAYLCVNCPSRTIQLGLDPSLRRGKTDRARARSRFPSRSPNPKNTRVCGRDGGGPCLNGSRVGRIPSGHDWPRAQSSGSPSWSSLVNSSKRLKVRGKLSKRNLRRARMPHSWTPCTRAHDTKSVTSTSRTVIVTFRSPCLRRTARSRRA
jgi:hypothetical protein